MFHIRKDLMVLIMIGPKPNDLILKDAGHRVKNSSFFSEAPISLF